MNRKLIGNLCRIIAIGCIALGILSFFVNGYWVTHEQRGQSYTSTTIYVEAAKGKTYEFLEDSKTPRVIQLHDMSNYNSQSVSESVPEVFLTQKKETTVHVDHCNSDEICSYTISRQRFYVDASYSEGVRMQIDPQEGPIGIQEIIFSTELMFHEIVTGVVFLIIGVISLLASFFLLAPK